MPTSLLYLIFKMIALILPMVYAFVTGSADGGYTVVTVLGFTCIFLLNFLLIERFKNNILFSVTSVITAAAMIALCRPELFPLTVLILVETADMITERAHEKELMFYALSALIFGVLLFSVRPQAEYAAVGAATEAVFLLLRALNKKIADDALIIRKQREELAVLRRRITNSDAYSKTLKESASLKERSRFAERIHDKLGHNISGSIILLEAARLNLKKDPKKAEECINTAVDTLRRGVDDIRQSLRQERPNSTTVGISELKAMMDRYKMDYDIATSFEMNGSAESVSPAVMSCIRDNMAEAMTNTLKHSDADKFSFVLNIMNKAIRAELWDNGRPNEVFAKGMGLTAIEERTERLGGKCVFSARADGFHVVMIFNIEQNKES